MALDGGADEAKVVPARAVVAADWVRLKCQFGCGGWNKRLCCPPHTPTPETTRRVLGEYRRALIYAYRPHDNLRSRRKMARLLAAIERQAFLDGFHKAFGLGAGPCRFCAECDTSRRCRFPYLARPSLESCGVDVYTTCRNAGIELHVVTSLDQTPKYVSVVLVD
jgi:predicted metal-binding protein